MDQYKIVVDQLDGHAQLLMTFALAICGGIMAAALQVMFHNFGKDRPIRLRYIGVLVAAYITSIVSLGVGYELKSMIVASIAALSTLNFVQVRSVTLILGDGGLSGLATFSIVQFAFLALSLLLLLVVLLGNLALLRPAH